jgi:hypothetical protein
MRRRPKLSRVAIGKPRILLLVDRLQPPAVALLM